MIHFCVVVKLHRDKKKKHEKSSNRYASGEYHIFIFLKQSSKNHERNTQRKKGKIFAYVGNIVNAAVVVDR